ncbi:hypothetical protein K438DRAFT_1774761 [Mycena galopus ATCC 62051]|nr:hypothetical protein K438DRAFT_1774761 [Mycena galopus ATCC 62051]
MVEEEREGKVGIKLTTDACQSLIRFRKHKPRHGLKNKALIDYWLTSVQDHAYEDTVFFPGFLTLSDIRPDEVLGQIRCITMPVDPRGRVYHHSDSHLLFIQATTPPTSGLSPAVSDSPVAIFNYHHSSSAEDDAPLWTRMTRTLEFRMDREDAAQLFAALALHPDNLLERGLSQRMVDWGSYAAVGTSAANKTLQPQTPCKAAPKSVPHRPVKRKQFYGDDDRTQYLPRRLFH